MIMLTVKFSEQGKMKYDFDLEKVVTVMHDFTNLNKSAQLI